MYGISLSPFLSALGPNYLVPYLLNHFTENENILHGEYNPLGQQLKFKWAQSEVVSVTDWLILTVIGS